MSIQSEMAVTAVTAVSAKSFPACVGDREMWLGIRQSVSCFPNFAKNGKSRHSRHGQRPRPYGAGVWVMSVSGFQPTHTVTSRHAQNNFHQRSF